MNFNVDNLLSSFLGNRTRFLLSFLASAVAITGYVYVVDFFDPNKNFLSQLIRGLRPGTYDFYSGPSGGVYIEIGRLLQQETGKVFGTTFINEPTSGAFENATSIASNDSSCGIVQEDTLSENDFFYDKLNYVTPLYIERMHILYRKSNVDQGVIKNSPESADVFNGRTVYTGSHRSGTKIFAGYLLNYLEEKAEEANLIAESGYDFSVVNRSVDFETALRQLEDNVDSDEIVVNIAGAPLKRVEEALKNHEDIGLMEIAPTVLLAMNRKYSLNLRPVTFEGIYEDGNRIPTIGSYAFLVCSMDVPNAAILKMIEIIDSHKREVAIKRQDGKYILDEYEFLSAFKKQYNSYLMDLFRNFFLFVVSIALTVAASMAFMIWCLSSYKHVTYFREITQLYTNFLPENTKLDDKIPPFHKPIINAYQNEIVSDLIRGISSLIAVTQNVRKDYQTGGITNTHYNHLLESIVQIKDLFQINLFRRLYEVLEAGRLKGEYSLTKESLRHYHTAGYLTYENYIVLDRHESVASE